jgi:ferrochelatase
VIRDLAKQGVRYAVVQPIGFLCDHVEVLYDLGIEAAEVAEDAGIHLLRAGTVNDHPKFIQALADVVEKCLRHDAGYRMQDAG